MHKASSNGHVDIVRCLVVDAKADVNAVANVRWIELCHYQYYSSLVVDLWSVVEQRDFLVSSLRQGSCGYSSLASY